MTDSFEDAVRSAGRGLASPEPAPTYHGAWKRGRRRRLAKRSAVAVAGVVALVVAFSTDLGRFQGGSTTIDVDDVAMQGDVVPAPTAPSVAASTTPSFEPTSVPVATTEPVVVEPDVTPDAAASGLTASEPDLALDGEAAAATTNQGEPTPAPTEPSVVPPTAVPTVIPTPTLVPEPTAVPTSEPTVEPTPTPSIAAAPDPDPSPATLADPSGQADSADDTQTTPADETPGSVDTLPPVDPQSATRLGLPADARIAPGAIADGAELQCDIDGDGTAEAVCELLPMYLCDSIDEVRAGYQGLDLDGDNTIDTCVAIAQTTCDTTGDGVGDASCRIRSAAPGEIPDNDGP